MVKKRVIVGSSKTDNRYASRQKTTRFNDDRLAVLPLSFPLVFGALYCRPPRHGDGLSPLVHLCIVEALVRAEADGGDKDDEPDARNDEADGEDHELDAGEDKDDGAVLEAGDLLVDGGLGPRKVGHDDVLGEDACEEGGLVDGDVCADGAAGAVLCGESEGWHDDVLEVGPRYVSACMCKVRWRLSLT